MGTLLRAGVQALKVPWVRQVLVQAAVDPQLRQELKKILENPKDKRMVANLLSKIKPRDIEVGGLKVDAKTVKKLRDNIVNSLQD